MKWIRKQRRFIGWFLFLFGVGIFCLQSGFLFLHEKYHIEYVDQRLFYMLNIICVICLFLGCYLSFKITKRVKQISMTIVIIFVLLHVGLLIDSHRKVKHVIRSSPDFNHVLIIKENVENHHAVYYRNLYGIFSRPHTSLPGHTVGEFKVDWLANDVAVVTYVTDDDMIQQFIGTYGDRSDGHAYYYVGAEITGYWQGDQYEVISDTEGITVTTHGEKELFTWENVEQFGTLAIVLKKDNNAIWTIALNENFVVQEEASQTGHISLYQATMEKNQPIILQKLSLDE